MCCMIKWQQAVSLEDQAILNVWGISVSLSLVPGSAIMYSSHEEFHNNPIRQKQFYFESGSWCWMSFRHLPPSSELFRSDWSLHSPSYASYHFFTPTVLTQLNALWREFCFLGPYHFSCIADTARGSQGEWDNPRGFLRPVWPASKKTSWSSWAPNSKIQQQNLSALSCLTPPLSA